MFCLPTFILLAICGAHITFQTTPSNSRIGSCGGSVDGFPASPQTLVPFQRPFQTPRSIFPKLSKCDQSGACIDYFEITTRAVNVTIFPNQSTTLFGYDGQVPGPTIKVNKGRQFVVRFINQISQTLGDRNGDGFPDLPSGVFEEGITQDSINRWPISVHLHGSASLAAYDGWADDITRSGQFKDYYYPGNNPTIQWYHDHGVHVTSVNAILGLAGMALVYDGCNPYERLLPHEKYDKELFLTDRVFDRDGQIFYDHTGPHKNDYYGDHIFVNGVAWPTMPVEPRKYRFRMLVAGPTRPFALYMSNGMNITVLGTEGGLFLTPRPVSSLIACAGERYDFVIDFTGLSGQTIYLKNGDIDKVPRFCQTHLVMKFEVTLPLDHSIPDHPLPPRLRHSRPNSDLISDKDLSKARADFRRDVPPTREFKFERKGGEWAINGVTWAQELKRVLATGITQNSVETWDFYTGGGWFHPVHLHLVEFLMVDREKTGLLPYEVEAAKDMVYLGPGERVRVIVRFGPFAGDYMFHCHNLIHEDFDMMAALGIGRAKPIGVSLDKAAEVSPSPGVDPNTQDYSVREPRMDTTNVFKGTPVVPEDSPTRSPMSDRAKDLNRLLLPSVEPTSQYLEQVLSWRLYEVYYPLNQSRQAPVHMRRCSVEDVTNDSALLCDPYEVDYTSCISTMSYTRDPYIACHPTTCFCPAFDGAQCEVALGRPSARRVPLVLLGVSGAGVMVLAVAGGVLLRRRKRSKVIAVGDVELRETQTATI